MPRFVPSAPGYYPGKAGALSAPPVPARGDMSQVDPIGSTMRNLTVTQKVWLGVHGIMIAAITYHGYKRNRGSLAWTAAWAMAGLFCPTVTMGFALTQGFGKRTRN